KSEKNSPRRHRGVHDNPRRGRKRIYCRGAKEDGTTGVANESWLGILKSFLRPCRPLWGKKRACIPPFFVFLCVLCVLCGSQNQDHLPQRSQRPQRKKMVWERRLNVNPLPIHNSSSPS